MPITRLNHAVLFVSDVARSVAFYRDVLGFRVLPVGPSGLDAAFLQAPGSTNDHDLGLFAARAGAPGPRAGVGLYHLAWEVDTLGTLAALRDELARVGALGGASDHGTTKSVYGHDPDGIDFELAWIVPADQLTEAAIAARATIAALDLDAEIARYGRDTAGGLGVSQPAPADHADQRPKGR